MSFYTALASTAVRLLTDKGQTVTFSRTTGTFDPALGQYSATTVTTFTGKAAAFGYNNAEIDGSLIKNGDVRLVCESTTTVPAPNDTCTVNSIVYRVMNVEPIAPAGITVINKVQLRK